MVGVAEVEGFADAVVRRAIQCDAGAGGVEDGEVIESGGAGRGWFAAEAFPCVQAVVWREGAGPPGDGCVILILERPSAGGVAFGLAKPFPSMLIRVSL